MMKQTTTFFIFIILFFVAFLLFIFHNQLSGISGLISGITLPVQAAVFQSFASAASATDTKQVTQIISQQSEAAKATQLEKENAALRDQFTTAALSSPHLLPANIIGMPRFLPGVSQPEQLIIDQGSQQGVRKNMPVVVKDILVGKVTNVMPTVSVVTLITNSTVSFTATTQHTSALGIARGQGGGKIDFENVELSDSLQKGDMVVTKGSENEQGNGFPPNLVIGQISAVNKTPSALYQTASLQISIDVTKLQMVFVLLK